MKQNCPIDVVLVPKGAEYAAVCRGFRQVHSPSPPAPIAIPIGPLAVTQFLGQLEFPPSPPNRPLHIVVMGLCGALSPEFRIGQRVMPYTCISHLRQLPTVSIPEQQVFSLSFWQQIGQQLQLLTGKASQTGTSPVLLSSDRVVCLADEKQTLGRSTSADIVDMEGAAILAALRDRNVSAVMLRVVSDNCYADLPDLNRAIQANGNLSGFNLTVEMLRHPKRAARLIRGSLKSLRELERLAKDLALIHGSPKASRDRS